MVDTDYKIYKDINLPLSERQYDALREIQWQINWRFDDELRVVTTEEMFNIVAGIIDAVRSGNGHRQAGEVKRE